MRENQNRLLSFAWVLLALVWYGGNMVVVYEAYLEFNPPIEHTFEADNALESVLWKDFVDVIKM